MCDYFSALFCAYSWGCNPNTDIRPGSESISAEIETVWHIDIVDPTKASPNVVTWLWMKRCGQGIFRYKFRYKGHSLGSGHTLLLSIKKQMVWKDADLTCLLNVGLARCWFNEVVEYFVWLRGYVWLQCPAVLVLMAVLICNPPWVGMCPWWTW